jgi:V8-like Glu-specific endopeptidase
MALEPGDPNARPRRRAAGLACAIAMAIAVGACEARTADAEVAASAVAIVAGTPDPDDPAVVAIVRRRVHCHEAFVETVCTGTLIDARVVLTAAHCLVGQPALDVEVFVGPRANGAGGRFYAVADQRVHPGYDPSTYENDLALLQLAIAPGVAPIALDAAPLPAVGATVRVVGYGGDGNGGGTDGVKQAGTSTLAAIEPRLIRTEPGPSLACGGDSGAPVFADDATGSGGAHLIGVVRSGDAACATYTNATLVAPYLDAFVRPYLAALPTPSRRAASLSAPLCEAHCSVDDDCPRGMLCLPERELGNLCGYAEQRSGVIEKPCAEDAECGAAGAICAASVAGDEGRTCGCFTTCRDRAAAADAGADAGYAPNYVVTGGGCSLDAARRPTRAPGALTASTLMLLLLARVRRSRLRTCARSSTCGATPRARA